MRDGHLNKCKECSKKDSKLWRKMNAPEPRDGRVSCRLKPTPVKHCLFCGSLLVRKTNSDGSIESPSALLRRKYCGLSCRGMDNRVPDHLKSKVGHLQRKEYSRNYYLHNKHKFKARSLARKAAKSGIIPILSNCEKCSSSNPLQMHHPDYTKPLYVIWLCSQCHGKMHRKYA